MKRREWSCGPHTLVQCSEAEREMNGDWVLGEHIEDMTAEAADEILFRALAEGAEPICENCGEVLGFTHPKLGNIMFGDCDECTYEDYYGETYSA